MSLTWNIIRKDLYRIRWILLLWLLVMVSWLGLSVIQAGLDEEGFLPFHIAASVFGSFFLPVILFGLVMGLQDDDPVSDSDAFWITRPISGGRLLAAKSLVLALIWVLPVAVLVPFWAIHSYNLRLFGHATLQTVGAQAFVTMLAVPFAVISPNGSRFVMNLILAAAALFILAVLYQLCASGSDVKISDGVLLSRSELVLSVWSAATVATVLIQYRRRRTRVSIGVLAAAAAMGFAVAECWSWDITRSSTGYEPSPGYSSLELQVGSASFAPNAEAGSSDRRTFRADYKVIGLREGDVATATSATYHLRWSDDSFSVSSLPDTADALAHASRSVALGQNPPAAAQAEFQLPAKKYGDRLLREAPGYTAIVDVEITHSEIVARLQTGAGATSVREGVSVKVIDFIRYPRELVIPLSESAPNFTAGLSSMLPGAHPPTAPTEYYFLINQEDGRSVQARAMRSTEVLNAATVRYFRTTLVFGSSEGWDGGVPSDFVAWARKATLVKVVSRPIGSFQRTIDGPRLELATFAPNESLRLASR